MDAQTILHNPFDIETHKNNFIHYLEVIIDSDGVVHYAVPSHQEYLIGYACEQKQITRQQLIDMVPREYAFDVIDYLCEETSCISVWTDRYYGTPNASQLYTLELLKYHGIYEGCID